MLYSFSKVLVVTKIIFSLYFWQIKGENILFLFAGGTYSHEIEIGPLVKSLADKGHKVSFLSSYSKKPFKHAAVEIIAPNVLEENMKNNWQEEKLGARLAKKEKEVWYQFPDWAIGICKLLLDSPDDESLRNLFYSNRTFDLVIIDAAINDCGFIIAHYFNAKTIVSDSTSVLPWHYDIYGLPAESSWIPVMSSHFDYPMTFTTRLQNFLETFYWTYRRYTYMYVEMENIMRKFLKKQIVPKFIDLERNVSLVFLNSHPTIDLPRALPPLFVSVGGMHCWDTENENVSDELTQFLDDSKNGVVLIVFGSTVNLAEMPQQIISHFFNAIEQFKHIRFIWKWVGPKPNNYPPNLMMVPWLPQKNVLGHPNVKAFVTHCGLNSLIEATFHAVPLIGIPLFGDQDLFAFRIQAQEIGKRIEVRQLTADTLISAISSVLNQQKYRENIKKMSVAFRDRPQNPIESATYWVEYVLRTEDTSFLRPKNLNQPLFQRHCFDVVIFIFVALTIGVAFVLYFSLFILKNVADVYANKTLKCEKQITVTKKLK